MNRRSFIKSAAALSMAVPAEELAAASADPAFDPVEQPIASLQRALAAGTVSSEALTAAYLARIARYDQHGPGYRSVLALNPRALAAARTLDAERRAKKL